MPKQNKDAAQQPVSPTGRATQRRTNKAALLIGDFVKNIRGRKYKLLWHPDGCFLFVAPGRRTKRLTRFEALQQFARFYTNEYLEGSTERAYLLLYSANGTGGEN